MNTGLVFKEKEISFSDYLDYWYENYCELNLKYNTRRTYKTIMDKYLKKELGKYRLNAITSVKLNSFIVDLCNRYNYKKSYYSNILKVLKNCFRVATDVYGFIKYNPTITLKLPKIEDNNAFEKHLYNKQEINRILERFKDDDTFTCAFITSCFTGMRTGEVFALTWDDIDLENKKLTVNKNVLKKNQAGATHGRHISGKATTMWFFGTCKTPSSYRTIDIGDTLVNALKEYKAEQEANKKEYGDFYMMHYAKTVKNPYTNKDEIKIINAYKEIDVGLPTVDFVFVKHIAIRIDNRHGRLVAGTLDSEH